MRQWRSWFTIFVSLTVAVVGAKLYKNTLLHPLGSTPKAECECGKLTRKLDSERIGKARVPDGRLPWLVELLTTFSYSYTTGRNGVGGDSEFRLCFGALITLQSALFPASCIDRYSRYKPLVKLHGLINRRDNVVETITSTIHPAYRGKYDNDLALVKLKYPINTTDTKVIPICLPEVKLKSPILNPVVPRPVKESGAGNENLLTTTEREKFDRLPIFEEEETTEQVRLVDKEEDNERKRPCRNPYPPCISRPCTCPNEPKEKKKPYVLEAFVARSWFYRKAPGYDYLQKFGRFQITMPNETRCHQLFPEMLRSKVMCLQQKEIKDVVREKSDFFLKMELGMPVMLTNTTLVKGKPQAVTTKFYLEGMRAPGRSGIPMLGPRENVMGMLKIEDYIPWIRAASFEGHFCKS